MPEGGDKDPAAAPPASHPPIPEAVQRKLDAAHAAFRAVADIGEAELKTVLDGKVSFHFRHAAPTDVLTIPERAQQVCFVVKYDALPSLAQLNIVTDGKRWHLGNIDYIRHILNEFRPIVQNQGDSIYYKKIHSFCYAKLGGDYRGGLSIRAVRPTGEDITDLFKKMLGERQRAIGKMLAKTEFGYIYNGILQHSDARFAGRFWREYTSGELNYVLIRHARVLEDIRRYLYWHYQIVKALTFPTMGPL